MNKIIKYISLSFCLKRKISIKSLNCFIPNRFEELFGSNMYNPEYDKYGDYESNKVDLIAEINGMDLKNIEDFNAIIKDDLISTIKRYNLKLNYLGLTRLILITGNHNKYFESLNKLFIQWDLTSFQNWNDILLHYNITPDILNKKIKEQDVKEMERKKVRKDNI